MKKLMGVTLLALTACSEPGIPLLPNSSPCADIDYYRRLHRECWTRLCSNEGPDSSLASESECVDNVIDLAHICDNHALALDRCLNGYVLRDMGLDLGNFSAVMDHAIDGFDQNVDIK